MKFLKKVTSLPTEMEENVLYYATEDNKVGLKKMIPVPSYLTRVWYDDGSYKEYDIEGRFYGVRTQYGPPTPSNQIDNVTSAIKIEFGDTVTSIKDYPFGVSVSPKLESVSIPNSVTEIGEGAFNWCSNLTSVTIPDSVTSIGACAFSSCSSLSSITIPDGVTSIGNYAFNGCYFTRENFINKSSLGVEANNYWGATVYEYMTEDGLCIRDNIVVGCKNKDIASITIPNSVTEIGEGVFNWCSNLTSVTIPNSVTSIGDFAFGDVLLAKSNFINNSSLDAEENNYWGATVYDYITEDGLIIGDNIVVGCKNKDIASITIPDGITSIGDGAFIFCSSLTSITYKGTEYTSKSTLTTALTNNGVSVGSYVFDVTALSA